MIATVLRTLLNLVLVLLFLLALYVVGRRTALAWNAGETGETILWVLITLGTVSLTVRAVRRTVQGTRREK